MLKGALTLTRKLFFVYGVACHALFLVVYAWMAAFVGNLGFGLIPTIDSPRDGSAASAILVDLTLIAVFGLQHSVMARPTFKRWWTQFVPQPIERSTYVLASNIVVALLLWQWRPIGGMVWDVQNPIARVALHGLFAFGWFMVPLVSLMINHFDLFGTRQVWLHLRGRPYENLPFRTPMAYAVVRHPLYVGWMIAFWATPTLTMAHLIFAAGMTAYILIAIPFEERNLVSHFGPTYERYRRNVGGLIPKFTASRRAGASPAVAAATEN
jgi:protein-S-isoprenylcysteine O-methyltransferase Ste14